MSDVASAVAGTVADLFGGSASDVAPEVVNSPEPAGAPEIAQEPVIELPDLSTELPDDIQELLDAPDFDEDPAPTFTSSEDEFVDPEELARENAKLRKKLEWEQTQKLNIARKNWAAEATKYFPYARPDQINATSRRAFLRAAKEQHDAVAVHVLPALEAARKAEAEARAVAEAKVRAEAAEAWGKPTVGGSVAPSEAAQKSDDLQRARNSRDLAKVARALIDGNVI